MTVWSRTVCYFCVCLGCVCDCHSALPHDVCDADSWSHPARSKWRNQVLPHSRFLPPPALLCEFTCILICIPYIFICTLHLLWDQCEDLATSHKIIKKCFKHTKKDRIMVEINCVWHANLKMLLICCWMNMDDSLCPNKWMEYCFLFRFGARHVLRSSILWDQHMAVSSPWLATTNSPITASGKTEKHTLIQTNTAAISRSFKYKHASKQTLPIIEIQRLWYSTNTFTFMCVYIHCSLIGDNLKTALHVQIFSEHSMLCLQSNEMHNSHGMKHSLNACDIAGIYVVLSCAICPQSCSSLFMSLVSVILCWIISFLLKIKLPCDDGPLLCNKYDQSIESSYKVMCKTSLKGGIWCKSNVSMLSCVCAPLLLVFTFKQGLSFNLCCLHV